jgi:hypothetical protein
MNKRVRCCQADAALRIDSLLERLFVSVPAHEQHAEFLSSGGDVIVHLRQLRRESSAGRTPENLVIQNKESVCVCMQEVDAAPVRADIDADLQFVTITIRGKNN